MKKIMLLGSGELGKEFVIACKRKGMYVIACDKYNNAPAMQVADEREVFSMLDGDALMAAVKKHNPDIIVPEIEAIRTEKLYECEQMGIQVTPSNVANTSSARIVFAASTTSSVASEASFSVLLLLQDTVIAATIANAMNK